MFSQLNDVEQTIVEYALSREKIDRNVVVDEFAEDFNEEAINDAFTALKQENRLFKRGNQSEYVMIRRDLF